MSCYHRCCRLNIVVCPISMMNCCFNKHVICPTYWGSPYFNELTIRPMIGLPTQYAIIDRLVHSMDLDRSHHAINHPNHHDMTSSPRFISHKSQPSQCISSYIPLDQTRTFPFLLLVQNARPCPDVTSTSLHHPLEPVRRTTGVLG